MTVIPFDRRRGIAYVFHAFHRFLAHLTRAYNKETDHADH